MNNYQKHESNEMAITMLMMKCCNDAGGCCVPGDPNKMNLNPTIRVGLRELCMMNFYGLELLKNHF